LFLKTPFVIDDTAEGKLHEAQAAAEKFKPQFTAQQSRVAKLLAEYQRLKPAPVRREKNTAGN